MIGRLTGADIEAASAISARFGWPHRPEDWAINVRLGEGLAWRDAGRVLGTLMLFPLDRGHVMLGEVQVSPEAQGRGIGRRLMEAALEQAGAHSLMLLTRAEGAGLYRRLGFVPAGAVEQWQGRVAAFAPRPARALQPSDRDEVLAMDAKALGVHRRSMLDTLLGLGPGVIEPAAGFALSRPFGHGSVIGPVVARGEDAAQRLVAGLLQPGFQRIDVPAGLTHLPTWLHAAGLHRVGRVEVMVRGPWPPGGEGMRRFALASQSMG